MQKIILIALLATCAIAAQTNVKKSDGVATVGTLDGYVVSMGVIQSCHYTCATCDGPLETNCLTCAQAAVAADSMTVQTATGNDKGKCGCWTTAKAQLTVLVLATPKLSCEAAGTAGSNAAHDKCAAFGAFSGIGADANAMACVLCPSKFKACITKTTGPSDATTAGANCWAGVTATTDCVYAITTSYIQGDVNAYDNTGKTAPASVVNGYYIDSTFAQLPCAKGCISCTTAAAGCVCATGFTIVGTTQACECAAEGNFSTAASATAVDLCTACGTGCKTCSSATVCTVCDSSHQLGSTTSSSSTCESLADTSATTSTDDTTTTSGTADGETSATATATNGVLITAASMLLAVILA